MKHKPVFFRLMPYIKKNWGVHLLLIVFWLVSLVGLLYFTWFLQSIVDAAVRGDQNEVYTFLIIGTVIIAAMVFIQYSKTYLETVSTHRVVTSLKTDLYAHLLKLPTRYHTSHHSGDSISRLTNDVNGAGGAIGMNLLSIIIQPLSSLTSFIYLVGIHWQLAFMSLIMGPAAVLLGKFFGKLIRRNGETIQAQLGKMNEFLNDSFAGHLVIRTFGLGRPMTQRFVEQSDDVLHLQIKEGKLRGRLQASSFGVTLLAQMVVMGLGAIYVVQGKLTMGDLMAFLTLTQGLISPFSTMANLWAQFQRSLASVERVFSAMDEPAIIKEFPDPVYPVRLSMSEGIRYENISFSYDQDNEVLKDFNLFIPSGKTVAFVGPSGAGKSTIFNLTLGVYTPNSGEIHFDGKIMNEDNFSEMNSYMSLVPQETFLFSGTIRENILLGKIGSTEDEVIEAAKAAQAHQFIMELPQGYDTEVGERGVKLSGGQKQRISIARAILRDAPVLLLDEATSSLDSESETAIQLALKRLIKGRTTLVIAHRLSTVLDADIIVVMENGRIVDSGTHDNLIEKEGIYSRLYQLQHSL